MASHSNISAANWWGSSFGGRSKVLGAWGHYTTDVICVVIVTLVTFRFAPPPRITVLPIATLLFVAVIGSWLALRRHDRLLCEPCLTAMPLDPARRAQRLGYRFRIAHVGSRRSAVAAYTAVVMGSVALPGTVGLGIWLAVQLSLIVAIRSYVTHRRLQPWCPICSVDGGGSRVEDVNPVRPHDPQRV